jgi:flotillin
MPDLIPFAVSLEWVVIAPVVFFTTVFFALIVFFLYRRAWRIPQPNEALIIVGRRKGSGSPVAPQNLESDVVTAIQEGRTEGLDFRISTTATWVNPVTSRVSRLPLDSRSTDFSVDCHDTQKIACTVRGVILYKVGDNYPAMAAAARRFLTMKQEELNESIRDLVTGQVRALVGGMTIPDLITDRQQLMDNIRTATYEDMARLGLQIDSLTVQDIADPKGYIDNLGRPQAEAVAQAASVAADQARQEKERAAKAADLEVAKVTRDTEVEAARYQAERDRAAAEAAQAGPLAHAEAQRAVVAQETEVAQLQVAMTEKRLDAEVRKAADAEKYASIQAAEAEREAQIARAEAEAERETRLGTATAGATRARGEAEAEAIKARGLAEADGIRAKAEALAKNGALVIDKEIAERMGEIARAFAEPLGAIQNMIVLGGPDGLTKSVVGAVSAAGDAINRITDLPWSGGARPGSGDGDKSPLGASATPDEAAAAGAGAEPAGIDEAVRDRTKRAVERARRSASSAAVADQAATEGGEAEPEHEPGDAGTDEPAVAAEQLDPVLKQLAAGDLEPAVEAVRIDPELRESLRALAADEELAAQALDRARLRGARRRVAERLLKQLSERI